jgi:threonyl-tRNA synthetase
MPQRFDLRYTDADGSEKQPVMIHRALMGSMERFIGILIEHFGGDLPLWLAPVQVKVIPISDRFLDYAHEVCGECTRHGIRAEVDGRSEKVGYKIREAEIHKIPCMAVVGEKEQQCTSVSPRYHTHGDANNVTLDEFIASLRANIDSKSLSYAA